jgi:hypothetical protein
MPSFAPNSPRPAESTFFSKFGKERETMPMSRDLREFVECLNSNKADYLIVGALAVSWHGFPRYSGDIDFLVRPTLENAQRVRSALVQFGFGELDVSLTDLTAPGKVIQLGYEPNRIDLMTSITGVSFESAWESRVSGELDGLSVFFIGRAALLQNKDSTGRNKDKIDADQLRRQRPGE